MSRFMIPLGGGNEIGASCYLYFIDGVKVLVDSGLRFSKREPFPDFKLLKSIAPSIDAAIITHAHIDHCGSFHILSSLYPDTPFYMTHETAQLLPLMVEDAIKVRHLKDRGGKREYEQLDFALSSVERRDFFDPIRVKDVEIELIPSGHIVGSASVLIRYGDSGSVYHSGDISLKPQKTVNRASVPPSGVDLAVLESTYLYAKRRFDRESAVDDLYRTIREVIGRKGKMLIPVFALGRAQEIALLISEGMRRGEIPPFTAYIDGLAREVSSIYENLIGEQVFNYFVQPAPRYEGLSFSESCAENMREADCIISTSGMLVEGTPSHTYASILSKSEGGAIIFSGYMVEESFGYKLLNDRETIRSLRCEVKRHHFSAHAGEDEVEQFIESFSPKRLSFVHGYPPKGRERYHAFNGEVVRF